MILLTDGASNAGEVAPVKAAELAAARNEAEAKAKAAALIRSRRGMVWIT
jgi:hypothetical protein